MIGIDGGGIIEEGGNGELLLRCSMGDGYNDADEGEEEMNLTRVVMVVLAVQRREQRPDPAVDAFPPLIRAKPRRWYT